MFKKFKYSFVEFLDSPSTIFNITETAARLNCEVSPLISDLGNEDEHL